MNKLVNSEEIIITNKNNKKEKGKILFITKQNDNEYIFYELKNKLFVSKLLKDNKLEDVSEEEWPILEEIYQEYIQENATEEDSYE